MNTLKCLEYLAYAGIGFSVFGIGVLIFMSSVPWGLIFLLFISILGMIWISDAKSAAEKREGDKKFESTGGRW